MVTVWVTLMKPDFDSLLAQYGECPIPALPGSFSDDVLRKIQEVLFPYEVSIIKSERSLSEALEKLQTIQSDLLPQMKAADPHYLLKLIEVQGIAFISFAAPDEGTVTAD